MDEPFRPNTGIFPNDGNFTSDSVNVFDNISVPSDAYMSINPNDVFKTDGEVATKVKNSVAYKQAHEVLSKESNTLWLQRLEAIPYSVDDAYQTKFDKWHWSNKYEDKQDANYQYCMEQISALMQEYQAWKNSLPVEQVNQLAQAGINSAVTGQGVNPSQIPNVGVNSDPSTLESTNAIGVVAEAANFMLNAVGGFADLVTKFSTLRRDSVRQRFDMKMTERNFISDINKYAREHGIVFDVTENDTTSRRNLRSFSDFGNFVAIDPEGKSIELKHLFENSKVMSAYAPLIAHALATDSNFASHYLDAISDLGSGDMVSFANMIVPKSVAIDAVTEAQYAVHKSTLHWSALNQDYQNQILGYQTESAEYKAKTDQYLRDKAKYDKEIAQIKTNLIETLHKSPNPDDKLLLMKILNNVNASDIEVLKATAEFAESNAALGLIKGIIPFTQSSN